MLDKEKKGAGSSVSFSLDLERVGPPFFFFWLFRATPAAYGGSQSRGRIRAVAAGLHHSHSNAGSEPCLQLIPQLMAMA